MHGDQVVDHLHLEACLIEFAQDGRDVLEATCGSAHGGSVSQFHGAAFAVAGDAKMGAKAFQCGFGSVLKCQWDGVMARSRPDLDLAGLQFKIDRDRDRDRARVEWVKRLTETES